MKKWMNTNIIFVFLIIILLFLAYKYFNSIPIEADNTNMNDDDNIYLSLDSYQDVNKQYSFIDDNYDFDFSNNKFLKNIGNIKK